MLNKQNIRHCTVAELNILKSAMVHQENCTVVDTIHALRCSTVGPHPDKWSISGRIAGSSISASISSCISNGIFVNSSITIGHRPSASSRPRSPWPSLVSPKSPSMHRQKSNFKQHKKWQRYNHYQPISNIFTFQLPFALYQYISTRCGGDISPIKLKGASKEKTID